MYIMYYNLFCQCVNVDDSLCPSVVIVIASGFSKKVKKSLPHNTVQ